MATVLVLFLVTFVLALGGWLASRPAAGGGESLRRASAHGCFAGVLVGLSLAIPLLALLLVVAAVWSR